MKRQTIWLLTMLSLVVVLSVYYVTTPDQMKTAGIMNMTSNNSLDSTPSTDNKKDDGKETTSKEETTNEVFLKQRMEQEDKRAQLQEEFQTTIDSATASAEEKSQAFTSLKELQTLTALEADVETMIKESGYKDALVRADSNEVNVAVKSTKKHSKAQANEIIQMARSVLGEKLVIVTFQTK